MNPDEIQEAAKEAGLYNNDLDLPDVMQNFAAIIEKRTIERCAAECSDKLIDHISFAEHYAIRLCASAVRKLGEQ